MRVHGSISLIILFVCISTAGAGDIEYVGSTLWNSIYEVEISGDYAYCAFQNGLGIFNVSNPANIREAGKLYCQGEAWGLKKLGNVIYLADGFGGLRMIDVSDPLNPFLIGASVPPMSATDVEVIGNLAYVSDRNGRIYIVDISYPRRPFVTGWAGQGYTPLSIKVKGSNAYVAEWGGTMGVYDISNPALPDRINYYGGMDSPYNIFINDNYAYIASHDGVYIIDISDPYNLNLEGQILCRAHGVYVSEDIAYYSSAYDDLVIVDISDPANPVELGDIPIPTYLLDKVSNLIYVSGYYDGLSIVDVANPAQPDLIGRYPLYGASYDVCVKGNYAYVALGSGGMQIVDISDMENPVIKGRLNTGDIITEVCANDRNVFLSGYTNLLIVDVDNPYHPFLAGEIEFSNFVTGFAAVGDYVYAGRSGSGFFIFDVSNPGNPEMVYSYNDIRSPSDFYISDNYCYAVSSDSLFIFFAGNPAVPFLLGQCQIDRIASAIFVSGDYAYISGLWDFAVVNIEDRENPYQCGYKYISNMGYKSYVWVDRDYAYLSKRDIGLIVIDITDPTDPVMVDYYKTPGMVGGLFLANDNIFVADYTSLLILHYGVETHIADDWIISPGKFSLSQNYPNPFNVSTTIRYNLPEVSEVTIDIYDMLGRRLSTIHDGRRPAGNHQAIWNADGFSSGMYFYKINAGGYTETRKMVLLK